MNFSSFIPDTVKEVSVSFVRYALRAGLRIELVTTASQSAMSTFETYLAVATIASDRIYSKAILSRISGRSRESVGLRAPFKLSTYQRDPSPPLA